MSRRHLWGLKFDDHVRLCTTIRQSYTVLTTCANSKFIYLLFLVPLFYRFSFTTIRKDLGVVIDTKLKFHDHIRSVAFKAGGVASNLLKSTLCRSLDFMMAYFSLPMFTLYLISAHLCGTLDILMTLCYLNQYSNGGIKT